MRLGVHEGLVTPARIYLPAPTRACAPQKRMAAEQLRALVEGAPFIVHTASAPTLQTVQLL